MASKETQKCSSLKKIKASIINSLNGLKASYKSEQSLYIHLLASITLIILSIIFKITLIEWLVIIAIIGITLAVELVNTAIESTVDLVTKEYHPLAKKAKDIASAAEFVLAITSTVTSLIIFVSRI